jgi:hypothetical protein
MAAPFAVLVRLSGTVLIVAFTANNYERCFLYHPKQKKEEDGCY